LSNCPILVAMADDVPAEERENFETFRECLSEPVLKALAKPVEKVGKKKHRKKSADEKEAEKVVDEDAGGNDAEDLGDFIDVCRLRYYGIAMVQLTGRCSILRL
jgi:hypothetical protein